MIVVAGGMIRSGSTFTFNIARELLALEGSLEWDTANSLIKSVDGYNNYLLKSHNPDVDIIGGILAGDICCICTIRRPDEAIASWMRTFGFSFEHGLSTIVTWLEWYSKVEKNVLTIPYFSVEETPRMVILDIAKYLNINCEASFCDDITERYDKSKIKLKYDNLKKEDGTIDLGFSYYDPETFFHRRHISTIRNKETALELTSDQNQRLRESVMGYAEVLHRYSAMPKAS